MILFFRNGCYLTIVIIVYVYTVLKLVRKLCDSNLYPTSLELLRVHLAATIFSEDVQDLLERYKDDVSTALNIQDLDPLAVYLSHFWELLQINNSVGTRD